MVMTDPARPERDGKLGLILQEAFTVGVRLRTNRQVASDPRAFRAHIKQLLIAADREARTFGYDEESVRLAVYACVAFLDESLLTASQPMFSEWSRQPLQEEIFGDHVAGENFFRHLAELLARQDSTDLADLIEVYQLCLLLGFRGKYAANPAGIQSIVSMAHDKIRRIRGGVPPIAPTSALPLDEHVPAGRDPWIRRLTIAAAVALGLALASHLAFRFLLGSGLDELRALSASLIG